jgi:hypothetical protein
MNAYAVLPNQPNHKQPCVACFNRVNLQLTAENWVTTKTARVIVSVNAAGNVANLATLHDRIMQKLSQLSKAAKWHITSFQRSQDKSGLERVYVVAEARLSEAELATIQTKVKNISQPGETYKVESIIFQPSLQEMQQAVTKLRAKLYEIAKTELAQLNKFYPEQHYYLHKLEFVPIAPTVAGTLMLAKFAGNGGVPAAKPPLVVSNKVLLRANVIFASPPPSVE